MTHGSGGREHIVSTVTLAVGLALLGLTFMTLSVNYQVLVGASVSFATLPLDVPTMFTLGPVSLSVGELVTLFVAARVSGRVADLRSNVQLGILMLVLIVGTSAGVSRGYPLQDVAFDSRPVAFMACALFVVARLREEELRTLVVWLPALLWSAAVLILLSQAYPVDLNGRAETATLYSSAGGTLTTAVAGSERFTGPTTSVALMTIAGITGLTIFGRSMRRTWVLLVPAVTICAFSFSRNVILGIAASLLACLVAAALRGEPGSSAVRMVRMGGAVVLVAVVGLSMVRITPWGQIVDSNLQTYSSRVLGGLGADTLQRDSSANDRRVENSYLLDTYEEHSLLGAGFGFRYKPPSGTFDSFAASDGQLFGHNYYLWAVAKLGLFGFILLASWVFLLMRRITDRRPSVQGVANIALPILAAAMAVSVVAPYPEAFPTNLLFGGIVAVAVRAGVVYDSKASSSTHRNPNEAQVVGVRPVAPGRSS